MFLKKKIERWAKINMLIEWVMRPYSYLNVKKKKFSDFVLKDSQKLWEEIAIILNSYVGENKTW